MQKILWLDVETTGFSPRRNGIISIAAFMMVDGVIDPLKGRFVAEMNPVGREIEDSALAVNGFTRERIDAAPGWVMVHASFCLWLIGHGCRETPAICGGYVTSFDVNMIQGWFEASAPDTAFPFSDFIEPRLLDVCELAKRSRHPALVGTVNKKLATVSEALGVSIEDKAHTAEGDILATIEVWKRLVAFDEKGNVQ
jgi:DNA polymerase III epsilon subunit-like protein